MAFRKPKPAKEAPKKTGNNQGPNVSSYKKDIKDGEQLVLRRDEKAYLHPSMKEVDYKAAVKLAADMKLVSRGGDTGEMFYAHIPE